MILHARETDTPRQWTRAWLTHAGLALESGGTVGPRLFFWGGAMPLAPDRYDYSPIIDRPAIKWPNGARVAFWIAPNVEHYEYLPEFDGLRDPWPRVPYPDVQQYAFRDYGNRVGFWRMLEPWTSTASSAASR